MTNWTPVAKNQMMTGFLQNEDGSYLLNEDGSKIVIKYGWSEEGKHTTSYTTQAKN